MAQSSSLSVSVSVSKVSISDGESLNETWNLKKIQCQIFTKYTHIWKIVSYISETRRAAAN